MLESSTNAHNAMDLRFFQLFFCFRDRHAIRRFFQPFFCFRDRHAIRSTGAKAIRQEGPTRIVDDRWKTSAPL
ncbi:hypothetical protein PGTUg99_000345 [Puccinia graminis f. sp. tritici]|uniref:Uncharacterized protein n=1 Tax=Puccinia graminis f. sp. tritici TaxID=56615 RepID=A0A5B0PPF4_PUCGR|nr:hypothetical protein PGTUg99_000345 [Puccinia graminis f. sp. tritici]